MLNHMDSPLLVRGSCPITTPLIADKHFMYPILRQSGWERLIINQEPRFGIYISPYKES